MKAVESLSARQILIHDLDLIPPDAQKQIAFLRVWCLVEMHAAATNPSIYSKISQINAPRSSIIFNYLEHKNYLVFWGPRSFQFDLEMNINIPKKCLTLGLCLEYETFII